MVATGCKVGCERLQLVANGCNWVQMVANVCNWLRSVADDCKRLQLVEIGWKWLQISPRYCNVLIPFRMCAYSPLEYYEKQWKHHQSKVRKKNMKLRERDAQKEHNAMLARRPIFLAIYLMILIHRLISL